MFFKQLKYAIFSFDIILIKKWISSILTFMKSVTKYIFNFCHEIIIVPIFFSIHEKIYQKLQLLVHNLSVVPYVPSLTPQRFLFMEKFKM